MAMREVLEGYEGGFQIGGRRVTNLRYADDIILLACSEIQLQEQSKSEQKVWAFDKCWKDKGHDNRWVIV